MASTSPREISLSLYRLNSYCGTRTSSYVDTYIKGKKFGERVYYHQLKSAYKKLDSLAQSNGSSGIVESASNAAGALSSAANAIPGISIGKSCTCRMQGGNCAVFKKTLGQEKQIFAMQARSCQQGQRDLCQEFKSYVKVKNSCDSITNQ